MNQLKGYSRKVKSRFLNSQFKFNVIVVVNRSRRIYCITAY